MSEPIEIIGIEKRPAPNPKPLKTFTFTPGTTYRMHSQLHSGAVVIVTYTFVDWWMGCAVFRGDFGFRVLDGRLNVFDVTEC